MAQGKAGDLEWLRTALPHGTVAGLDCQVVSWIEPASHKKGESCFCFAVHACTPLSVPLTQYAQWGRMQMGLADSSCVLLQKT